MNTLKVELGSRSYPILIGEEGDVVAGHGRLAAARLLGMTEVPVIALRGLSEVQRRQLMLADNRIALNAGWDAEMLQLELRDLSVLGANLKSLGFTEQELAKALQGVSSGLTNENEIPTIADNAVTVASDVWCLGSHRLVCGDCTEAATVSTLLGWSALISRRRSSRSNRYCCAPLHPKVRSIQNPRGTSPLR